MHIWLAIATLSDYGMRFEMRIRGVFSANLNQVWMMRSSSPEEDRNAYIVIGDGNRHDKCRFRLGKDLTCLRSSS